jgi:CDP-paratose 2-epimerase
MGRLLVTGSSGLIGSEVVDYFCRLGWDVSGVDNNMRADFFGPAGDTRWNQHRLQRLHDRFQHHELDIRDRAGVDALIGSIRPTLIVHAAAQPSHDLSASRPLDDFDVNATGTLNLLEAARRHVPGVTFVHMSTNKVYGDRPNGIRLKELPTRWDYDDPRFADGIDETCPIDQSMHGPFGASKVAADVMTQEYGRYFGMNTCCLRGGCLTGPNHSGVELHGFLSYLVRCNVEGRQYRVYGFEGKQVRDNIHSLDVARFVHAFAESPRCGEVYNIGGGRGNSTSILEAFDRISTLSGQPMLWEYSAKHREGDHICYISNLTKMKAHYPGWDISRSLDDIFVELLDAARSRAEAGSALERHAR